MEAVAAAAPILMDVQLWNEWREPSQTGNAADCQCAITVCELGACGVATPVLLLG